MAADQLDGSEIHGFHTLQDLDIGNIVKDAGRRWLSCHEIYAIICNRKHFRVYSCPVNLPKRKEKKGFQDRKRRLEELIILVKKPRCSHLEAFATHIGYASGICGAILLFDRKRLRNFRKDGHNWKKKKGKTVNESHECLKVGNEERIHVYYVHGQDNPTFARRCYWLLDKNPERDIVLVHYRELKEESGDRHVYYAGDKDFLESTGLGDNLTVQNHEWRRHEINTMERDELLPINDSNNSTAPKTDEVSSFDQSIQIEVNDYSYDKKRQREDVKAQPEGSGSEDKRRRFPTFWDVVCEFKKRQSVQNFLEPILESVIRRVVNEVFEKHLNSMKQNCGNEATTSESRSLQMNSIDNLSHPLFSGVGIEGEDWSNIQVASDDTHIEQPRSYDGEASSSGLANVHYLASLPWTESPNGEFDYTQQCAPSPDTFSVWEYGLDNLYSMELRGDQALSFPDQVTSSLICDIDPMTLPFCDEDLQSAVNSLLSARSTNVAQMRWTKVFSVFKWFSLRKAVIV